MHIWLFAPENLPIWLPVSIVSLSNSCWGYCVGLPFIRSQCDTIHCGLDCEVRDFWFHYDARRLSMPRPRLITSVCSCRTCNSPDLAHSCTTKCLDSVSWSADFHHPRLELLLYAVHSTCCSCRQASQRWTK